MLHFFETPCTLKNIYKLFEADTKLIENPTYQDTRYMVGNFYTQLNEKQLELTTVKDSKQMTISFDKY